MPDRRFASPKTKILGLFASALVMTLVAPSLFAHCQIPCGIYGDEARFESMREHVTTLEKSIAQIAELSKKGPKDSGEWNQMVRWVNNKEDHAAQLSEIITYYFMAQRIKPAADGDAAAMTKYQKELSQLHQMLVHAMKVKQTTDAMHTTKLRELIDAFEASYMGEHGHKH